MSLNILFSNAYSGLRAAQTALQVTSDNIANVDNVGYARKVVDPSYWPTLDTLIDDYLADNPTRNRALDLLPLFAFVDEARVRRAVQDPLVKARPTFHYRLPNSEIHRPDWDFAGAWNDWLQVERLAADDARLAACCAAYSAYLERPLHRLLSDWTPVVWLDP